MRNNSFAAWWVGLLCVNAIISAVLVFSYGKDVRNLRHRQPQSVAFQTRLNLAQALLGDVVEYSKHNPAMDSLLQSLNLKTNGVPASAPSKSPSK